MFENTIIYDTQCQVLETVLRNKFNNSRYYASFGYLQVLKRSELKLQWKPGETIFFRCSKAASPYPVMGSNKNSNSSMLLCMSWLPTRMKIIK